MTDEQGKGALLDEESSRRLRVTIQELERRGRALSSSQVRHDVSNAVGAARNALQLLDENPNAPAADRLVQIALRNVQRAEHLLEAGTPGADDVAREPVSPPDRSSGNQRDNLGGASERDHRDAFGL